MYDRIYEDLWHITMWKGYKAVSDSIFDEAVRLRNKVGRLERITDKELEWIKLSIDIVRSANDI